MVSGSTAAGGGGCCGDGGVSALCDAGWRRWRTGCHSWR